MDVCWRWRWSRRTPVARNPQLETRSNTLSVTTAPKPSVQHMLDRVRRGRVSEDREARWVARLTPAPSVTLAELLAIPLGLDVWERRADELVVAASEATLAEVERRRLAHVERISTVPKGPTGI